MNNQTWIHGAAVVGVLMLVGCGKAVQRVDPATLPDTEKMNLYEGDPPGEATFEGELPETRETRGRMEFVHTPTLEVFHAKGENRTGAAVVICPGGGYRVLAHGHEGTDIAKWLNANGITAIILRYRMHPYRHPVPMWDVQRAIKTVRYRASSWAIDPERIGVLGFSAGGHLASTAATHHEPGVPFAANWHSSVSSRPDFAILIYPVISMRDGVGHRGSRNNLLGPEPTDELITLMSNDEQVDATTPPTFLVHSRDDKAVLIENSERFFAALHKHGVQGRLVEYATGGHGYGLGRGKDHETSGWPAECIKWLDEIGVIEAADGE